MQNASAKNITMSYFSLKCNYCSNFSLLGGKNVALLTLYVCFTPKDNIPQFGSNWPSNFRGDAFKK
jgi:hypothetical protein